TFARAPPQALFAHRPVEPGVLHGDVGVEQLEAVNGGERSRRQQGVFVHVGDDGALQERIRRRGWTMLVFSGDIKRKAPILSASGESGAVIHALLIGTTIIVN